MQPVYRGAAGLYDLGDQGYALPLGRKTRAEIDQRALDRGYGEATNSSVVNVG